MSSQLWEVQPRDWDDPATAVTLWPLLQQVERDTNTEWPVSAILQDNKDRTLSLFAACTDDGVKALAGVTMQRFKNQDQVARIRFCVGSDRQLWQHHLTSIEDRMRAQGCTRMDGCFRRGWRRVLKPLGYEPTHEFLEKELI